MVSCKHTHTHQRSKDVGHHRKRGFMRRYETQREREAKGKREIERSKERGKRERDEMREGGELDIHTRIQRYSHARQANSNHRNRDDEPF
jgi:hypothetical protein